MPFKLSTTFGWIVKELARKRSVSDSMLAIIDKCEKALPHRDWGLFRTLPYSDLSPLVDWIQSPFRQERPSHPLRGLWFGLFNPCPDGKPVADVYVCGSERFDADPMDNHWATSPDWWPNNRYANSTILTAIYRTAHRQGAKKHIQVECLGNNAEYPLCLGFASFAVQHLLSQYKPTVFLGKSRSLGIAVGFDSGDFILLGELTSAGLHPIPERAVHPPPLAPFRRDLRSSDPKTVFKAASGLSRLGDRARILAPELLRIARSSEDFGLRQLCIYMLSRISPEHRQFKPLVLEAFKDPNPFVRREALQAAIDVPGLTQTDLMTIKDMEKDADAAVSSWSEIALRNIRINKKRAARRRTK